MRKTWILLLAAAISILGPQGSARAGAVEVSLPALSGDYGSCQGALRETGFRFDGLPLNIRGVSLRLQGWTHPGYWVCDWTIVDLARRIEFVVTMPDSVTMGAWGADKIIGDQLDYGSSVSFDITLPLAPANGATLDFLKDSGRGTIVLKGRPEPVQGGGLSCIITCPAASVYIATLVVVADYAIRTEPSTWGKIKSLFSK
jgi:hypothetical protein